LPKKSIIFATSACKEYMMERAISWLRLIHIITSNEYLEILRKKTMDKEVA
jgi:hypothetical protein